MASAREAVTGDFYPIFYRYAPTKSMTDAVSLGEFSRESRQWEALDRAISPARLATYLAESGGDADLARRLYLWDRDISMALLADIAVIEVALRNAMAEALRLTYGSTWFMNPDLALDDRSLRQLQRAWSDLPNSVRSDGADDSLPGRLVARCMFGFWANLLDAGGYAGLEPRRRPTNYEELWRRSLHAAFAGGPSEARSEGARFTRPWAHAAVRIVNNLRNRLAHHEPLIRGFPLPGQRLRLSAQDGHDACLKLARMLDRDLAEWLEGSTAVPQLLARRPVRQTSADEPSAP